MTTAEKINATPACRAIRRYLSLLRQAHHLGLQILDVHGEESCCCFYCTEDDNAADVIDELRGVQWALGCGIGLIDSTLPITPEEEEELLDLEDNPAPIVVAG